MRDPVKALADEIDDPYLLVLAWADAHEEAGDAAAAHGLRVLAAMRRWPRQGPTKRWHWRYGWANYRPGMKAPAAYSDLLPRVPCHYDALEGVPYDFPSASAALLAAARYYASAASGPRHHPPQGPPAGGLTADDVRLIFSLLPPEQVQ